MTRVGNLEAYGVIYKITNKVNGKVYIGQTTRKDGFNGRYNSKGKGIERVYNYHVRSERNKGKRCNYHLLKSIEKHGFENFSVAEVYDVGFSKTELDLKEKIYIKLFNSIKEGYNTQEGGNDYVLRGREVVTNKYSEQQIAKVKELYSLGYSIDYVHKNTKVSKETISTVCNLRTWLYVREDLNEKLNKMKNERDRNSNLNINSFKDRIRILYNDGKNVEEIVNILFSDYNLSNHKIGKIRAMLRKFKYEDLNLVRYCNKCNKEFTLNIGDEYYKTRKYCYKCSPKKKSGSQTQKTKRKKSKIKTDTKVKKKKNESKFENKTKTKQLKEDKLIFLKQNEKYICELYTKYKTFVSVCEHLTYGGFHISNEEIKKILKNNNIEIIDSRKLECYLNYVKVTNNKGIAHIFEYKFECVEWMIEEKMFFDKKTAKNKLNSIIDKEIELFGYKFYKSNKEEYNNYYKS